MPLTRLPCPSSRHPVKRRAVSAVLAVALGGALLVGCSSDDALSASPSASPSPTPTPTPAPVLWAGAVCVERDNVREAVASLGRNLSYDVTSDRTALEQIDRQLRLQVRAVGDALGDLGTALQSVPVDFKAANDFVVDATKAKDDTAEAVDATRQSLDEMVNADSVVTGIAAAGAALVSARAALEAGSTLVGIVTDGISTKGGELQAAFDAAPQCQGAS